MSAVKQAFLLRRRVYNPELGVPRKTPKRAAALASVQRAVCELCRFYVRKEGQDRCMQVDRKCERLSLGHAGERCPIAAWEGLTHG